MKIEKELFKLYLMKEKLLKKIENQNAIIKKTEKNTKKKHHERAQFERIEGIWYFSDGVPVTPKQFIRQQPKVGRNDPCPCGSGKKFKHCHGAVQ